MSLSFAPLASSVEVDMIALRSQKRDLARLIKRAQNTKAKAEHRRRRSEAGPLVSHAVADIVLILYQLHGYRVDCAVAFLSRRAGWRGSDDASLGTVVEDLVLASSDEHFVALVDAEFPRNQARLDRAVRFYSDWSLTECEQGLNLRKGVAPRSVEVLARRSAAVELHPRAAQLRSYAEDFASDTARAWMKNWRRRWGGRYKKLLCRDKPPLEEAREKAWKLSFFMSSLFFFSLTAGVFF